MLEVCSYYQRNKSYVKVLWDENAEEIIILNYGYYTFTRLVDMKNMNYEMLSFIAHDFFFFSSVNTDLIYLCEEDIPYIKEERDGEEFLDELINNYEVEIRD